MHVYAIYKHGFLVIYRTFSEINEPEELEQKCLELCECLAEDLTERNLKVHVKISPIICDRILENLPSIHIN